MTKIPAMRLALAAWLIPLLVVVLLGIIYALDYSLPYPEPVGEPAPCYGTEEGETICPEEPPLPPPSTGRRIADVLSSENLRIPLGALGGLGGLTCAVLAIARTRKTRRENADDRLAFRVALAALIVLIVVPGAAGGLLLFALMTFRIAG